MDNTENKTRGSQCTIVYDGSCAMCSALIKKVDTSAQNEHFVRVDITKDKLPGTVSKQAAEHEIHVIDEQGVTHKNADAILKIMESYPQFGFWVKLGRLPVVKQMLPIGYLFVSLNRHFIFGPAARLFWLKIVLCLGFLLGILLSPKLWISSRSYPLIPVFDFLPGIPFPVDYVLFVLLILLHAAIIILPHPRRYIIVFLLLLGALGLLDQSRWQPWAYQYAFMLGTLSFFSWKKDASNGSVIASTCGLIVASIYFWSGFQKMNLSFENSTAVSFINSVVRYFPEVVRPFFYSLGGIIPFMEAGIGVGLLYPRSRNVAILFALTLHAFIIFALGPLGMNWNSVVWPWNNAMAAFVVILFWNSKESWKDILWTENSLFGKFVLLFFGIMPLLSFFNLWDSYLSSALYSNNITYGTIFMNDSVREKLPESIAQYVSKTPDARFRLDPMVWSFGELNVPVYPEKRIYKAVGRYVCSYAKDRFHVELVIHERPGLLIPVRKTSHYTCESL